MGCLREVEAGVDVWAVSRWAAEYRSLAEEEEQQARKRRQEAWQGWVDKGSKGGGRSDPCLDQRAEALGATIGHGRSKDFLLADGCGGGVHGRGSTAQRGGKG